jgi:hypothetical protein
VSKKFIADVKLLVSRLNVDDVMEKAHELHDLLPAKPARLRPVGSYAGIVGVGRGLTLGVTRKKRKKRKKTKRRRL